MEKGAKSSRMKQMRDQRKDNTFRPPMPECDAPYLIEYLYDVGPTLSSGAGPIPLTEQEIAAWQTNTGIDLLPWESRVLKRLSREFLSQMHASEKRDCPAPWRPAPDIDRAQVAARVRSLFRS